jgi:hypothetical protein
MPKSSAQLDREIRETLAQRAKGVRPSLPHLTRKTDPVDRLLRAIKGARSHIRLKHNEDIVLIWPLFQMLKHNAETNKTWPEFKKWLLQLGDKGTISLIGPPLGTNLVQYARERELPPSAVLAPQIVSRGVHVIGVLDE